MPKKKKLSNYHIAAQIRKAVDQKKQHLNLKFKIGEFVNQKYVTESVGLILEEVKAKKRYVNDLVSNHDGSSHYIADRYYKYTVKILWLHHPDPGFQFEDVDINIIKIRKEKKVLETPKNL